VLSRSRTSFSRQIVDDWELSADVSAQVDVRLGNAVRALTASSVGAADHAVATGGKRLRPALTLAMTAAVSGANADAAIACAAAVEALHSATLVHDDLIDDSAIRRGQPSVHARAGLAAAVITGDLLIAVAFSLVSGRTANATSILAQALADLCRGESLEDDLRFDPTVTLDQWLQVVQCKTGSLTRAACMLGAEVAEEDQDFLAAAAEFGMEFGVCLQLVDDLLDVVSSTELAGKPVGADFASGTVTMPAIFALQAHPELGELLRPGLDEVGSRRAMSLLRSPQAVEPAAQAAIEHAGLARQALLMVADRYPSFYSFADWPLHFVRAQLDRKAEPAAREILAAIAQG
jgi:octaprenyl-diphosphate synthase